VLDPYLRPIIDPPLNIFGKKLMDLGFTANMMTFMGFICGILAILSIIFHQYYLAASLIVCNRFADGLDGAIARQSQLTDFGGFLDIVCDFIIYSGVVFAFGLIHPQNLLYASFLIFSFIGPMTSFLAYAIVANKRQITTQKRGKKSFYYLGGICEGTETAAVLILFCLMPQHFNTICVVFGLLCWMTTLGRIYNAWIDFGEKAYAVNGDSSLGAYKEQATEIKSQAQ
jgi:phosphatidylglycerophosphate synthase